MEETVIIGNREFTKSEIERHGSNLKKKKWIPRGIGLGLIGFGFLFIAYGLMFLYISSASFVADLIVGLVFIVPGVILDCISFVGANLSPYQFGYNDLYKRFGYLKGQPVIESREKTAEKDMILETLRRYKDYLDEGLITQEEYEEKKKSLLK